MLDPEEKKQVNKGWSYIAFMWLNILFSLVLYIVVCYVLNQKSDTPPDSTIPFTLFRNILLIISALTIIAAYFIRKHMLKPGKLYARIQKNRRGTHYHPAVIQYNAAVMISACLANTAGIFGFVLFLLSRDFQTLYIFIAISAIATVYYRPQKEQLMNLANDMKKDSIKQKSYSDDAHYMK